MRRTCRITNHAQQSARALIFLVLVFLLGFGGDVLLLLLLFFVVGHDCYTVSRSSKSTNSILESYRLNVKMQKRSLYRTGTGHAGRL